MKKYIYVCIMLLFSLTPFLWFGIHAYQAMGTGDFLSIMDIRTYAANVFYVYGQNFLAGSDLSYLSAHLVPFLSFYWLLSLFKVSPYISTLLFISLILFISQVSMFCFTAYILHRYFVKTIFYKTELSFVAGMLYGFSPYIVGLYAPGHILLLIAYAFFPLILLLYDRLLTNKTFPWSAWFFLFTTFFFCASAFANIGSFMGILIALLFYSVLTISIGGGNIRSGVFRYFITCFTVYLSNAWWLTPYIMSIRQTAMVNFAASGIPSGFGDADVKATVANIIFGRAEYLLHVMPEFAKYISPVMTGIFSVCVVCLSMAVLSYRKHRFFLILLGMFILGIYVTKTSQLPFPEPYRFLYEHVRVFQIFRRPVSKFYWWPLFFYIQIVVIGIGLFMVRFRKVSRYILITSFMVSGYFIYLFANTPQMRPFNVPTYYYDAEKLLVKEHVGRIVVLPGTRGLEPSFNESVNNYFGIDMLWFVWPHSIIYPDSTGYSPGLPYKKAAVALMTAISGGQSICTLSNQFNVTHIAVRQDLSPAMKVEQTSGDLISKLTKNTDIVSAKKFGANSNEGFMLFSVDPKCSASLISLRNNSATLQWKMISPVQFNVDISDAKGPVELEYRTNFSKWWMLFPYGKWTEIGSLSGAHNKIFDFANGWDLNQPKSVSRSYTLYYLPQLFNYFGWIVTALAAAAGLVKMIGEKKYE